MDDNLTDNLSTKAYDAYRIENEYIRITVIPELGGRIHSALDKTNNYEFVYRNVVIKPSLIGMVGSWISGGVAWGFPHHHGPLTMAPFEHRSVENSDGSQTVWVAKTDYRHRMRMLLGITVRPGTSYIEAEVFLDNRTPLANSFMYWANLAVRADPTYQIFFDPSVQYAADHHKRDFARWPVGDGSYGGVDYAGVDVSFWRNIKKPVSFFCWDSRDDFIAGYSHGAKAGTAYVGNHRILPGKKVWEQGGNPEGNAWRGLLTDNEDHYIEIMAGAFSDNEPDYSWIQPYEVKHFKQYWFPIRDLDGVDFVNPNGALSLRLLGGNLARIRLNTTSLQKDAKVVLKARGATVFEQTVTVSPDRPLAADIQLDAGFSQSDLDLRLLSAQGQDLLSFQPQPGSNKPMPEPVVQPGKPEDFKSLEHLYLAGLRLDQFYNANLKPDPYYQEALKRDPRNYNLNVWLGIKACKNMDWVEAERRLRTAVVRVTDNYTRPKDGEAFYYLGVALRAQGKIDEAYEEFYKAVWSSAWTSAGYFALANLDCVKGDFITALEHIDRALSSNATSPKLLTLKVIILRKLGKTEDAKRLAEEIGKLDALDFQSRNELLLTYRHSGNNNEAHQILVDLNRIMRGDVELYLELATEYANAGFLDEAIDVLSRFEASCDHGRGAGPTLYYHLGYYWAEKGDPNRSTYYYDLASRQPREYCFPYRDESRVALEHARPVNPRDPLAPYLLGNLLYEHQPARAIKEWEAARALDPGSAMVYRNLAWGYMWYEKDPGKAIANLEEAVRLDGSDARHLYELDVVYECAKASPERRLAMLQKHRAVAEKRDDAMTRLVMVLILAGHYDEAIQILSTRHFHSAAASSPWEGWGELRNLYETAFQLRGLRRLRDGDAKGECDDFLKAYEYPANLEIGRPIHNPRFAQIFYLIGLGYEAVGDMANAREYFLKAVAANADDTEYLYYQGLAFGKLGQPEGMEEILTKLEKLSKNLPVVSIYQTLDGRPPTADEEAARQRFLRGLAYAGKGLRDKAHAEFADATSIKPYDAWYQYFLETGGL
jgi:tetratricopeptide (TPR) repeat protein